MACRPAHPRYGRSPPTSPWRSPAPLGPLLREVSRARHRLLVGEGRQRHHRRHRRARRSPAPPRPRSSTSTAICRPCSGAERPTGQGIADWLRSDAPRQLRWTTSPSPSTARPGSIPRGRVPVDRDASRWCELVDGPRPTSAVFVDAGTGDRRHGLLAATGALLLVTRGCYLALRRAAQRSPSRPDGVVLVAEPWRSLRPLDVERALSALRSSPRSASTPPCPRPSTPGLLHGRVPAAARPRAARSRGMSLAPLRRAPRRPSSCRAARPPSAATPTPSSAPTCRRVAPLAGRSTASAWCAPPSPGSTASARSTRCSPTTTSTRSSSTPTATSGSSATARCPAAGQLVGGRPRGGHRAHPGPARPTARSHATRSSTPASPTAPGSAP